jgi:hypothetical protein
VERRDAVDPARAVEGQRPHAHAPPVRLIDQRDGGHVERPTRRPASCVLALLLEVQPVDQVDDLHVARQQPLHQLHRPRLQRLRQQGVVGVMQGVGGDLPRILPGEVVLLHQDAHQLRHGDGRMGVVELDRGVVGQRAQGTALGHVPAHQILQRGGGEEELLAQAQLLALCGGIARVEHPRDRLGPGPARHRADMVAGIEPSELDRGVGLRLPQAQDVDVLAPPADDRHVVGHGVHGLGRVPVAADVVIALARHGDASAEADLVGRLRPGELPRIAFREPGLRRLALPAVLKRLAEDAVVVADAVADRRDRQARHALHEAGGEPPETAIAERRVGLGPLDVGEIDAQVAKRGPGGLDEAEIVHRVRQEPADQEFEREIIDPFVRHGAGLGPVAGIDDPVAQRERGGGEPIALAGGLGRLAEHVDELGADILAQRHDGIVPGARTRFNIGGGGLCRLRR